VQKGPGAIFFTTVFIETRDQVWRCDAADASAKRAACSAQKGTHQETDGCGCKSQRTVYPIGVEEIDVVFSHAFRTTPEAGTLHGSSDRTADHGGVRLDTTFTYKNGTTQDFVGGKESVKIRLLDLLQQAEIESLDDLNTNVPSDMSDTTKQPMYRTTGASLSLGIIYSNKVKDGVLQVEPRNPTVHATIHSEPARDHPGWAGWGSQTFYLDWSTGESGDETFDKLTRYRQGIVITYAARGRIYWWDEVAFLNMLIAAIVLLNFCRTLTDLIVFNLPSSLTGGLTSVLARKRSERVNRKGAFAALGLKAAVGARDFDKLDVDNDGKVNFCDLVKVFGNVELVNYDQAVRIAKTIMADAGVDTREGSGGLDFNDFMTVLEGGQIIDFQRYLKFVKRTEHGGSHLITDAEIDAAKELYNKTAMSNGFETEGDALIAMQKWRNVGATLNAAAALRADAPSAEDALRPVTLVMEDSAASSQPHQACDTPGIRAYPTINDNVRPAQARPMQVQAPNLAVMTHEQPLNLPPTKCQCGNASCRRVFFVPGESPFARCPYCMTVNKVPRHHQVI